MFCLKYEVVGRRDGRGTNLLNFFDNSSFMLAGILFLFLSILIGTIIHNASLINKFVMAYSIRKMIEVAEEIKYLID